MPSAYVQPGQWPAWLSRADPRVGPRHPGVRRSDSVDKLLEHDLRGGGPCTRPGLQPARVRLAARSPTHGRRPIEGAGFVGEERSATAFDLLEAAMTAANRTRRRIVAEPGGSFGATMVSGAGGR
jgi:hypothetical protein